MENYCVHHVQIGSYVYTILPLGNVSFSDPTNVDGIENVTAET